MENPIHLPKLHQHKYKQFQNLIDSTQTRTPGGGGGKCQKSVIKSVFLPLEAKHD